MACNPMLSGILKALGKRAPLPSVVAELPRQSSSIPLHRCSSSLIFVDPLFVERALKRFDKEGATKGNRKTGNRRRENRQRCPTNAKPEVRRSPSPPPALAGHASRFRFPNFLFSPSDLFRILDFGFSP